MKRIGFITKNKILAQSLISYIKNNPDLPFEPFALLSIEQAVIDAEVFGIGIAIIEMIGEAPAETGVMMQLCKDLRKMNPDCRILFLVPQENIYNRDIAMQAVNDSVIDDFVFTDTSLDYLMAKLLAF